MLSQQQYHSLPVETSTTISTTQSSIKYRTNSNVKQQLPQPNHQLYSLVVDEKKSCVCETSNSNDQQQQHTSMPATTVTTQRAKTTTSSSIPPSSNIRRLTAHFSNTSLKPVSTSQPANRSAIPSFNSGSSNPTISASYRHSIHTSSISSMHISLLFVILYNLTKAFLFEIFYKHKRRCI